MKTCVFGMLFSTTFFCSAQLMPLPAPLNTYYHSGNDFSRHDEVLTYFELLQKRYPNQLVLERYGVTNEGRPLFVVYLSSEQNMNSLEEIRRKHALGSQDETLAIAWLSYNVHGNESCGTEAAMETAYRLLTTEQRLLEKNLVILDPCLNPDGRDRYVNYFKQYHNQSGQLNEHSAEHDEPWPGGRLNHYFFDLNRDWAWLTQQESQQRIKLYNEWMPHLHVDFHEQGMNEPYYFPPAAEPYHEVITPWQRDFQKHIGKHHASYFDQKGWLYFSKEIFDLLYPSYGDTYPTFNGAIGMTYEQGGSGRAGLGVITSTGDTLTLKERIEHHVITGISTLETADDHHQTLIDEFQQFSRKSTKEKGITYVLDGSAPNMASLLTLLARHQIQFSVVSEEVSEECKGFDYFSREEKRYKLKKKDVLVYSQQRKGTLLNVLFEQKTTLSDSLTYDITAWSLPYAYGVPCVKVPKTLSITLHDSLAFVPPLTKLSDPYALAIPWENLNSVRVLKALLDSGLHVSRTEKEIQTAQGTLKPGTLLVLKADNPGKNIALTTQQLLENFNLQAISLTSGWAASGADLGSSSIRNIQQPKIGVLFTDDCSALSVGEIWHFLDAQVGIAHQMIRFDPSEFTKLYPLNVIFIPEGFRLDDCSSLKQWINDGGICIVMGNAAQNFMKEDFGMKEENSPPWTGTSTLGNYGSMERAAISSAINGAIYQCTTDASHPLAFGYKEPYFTLRLSSASYPFQGEIIQKIADKDAWVSGFVGHEVKNKQPGTVTVGSYALGEGKIVYFFDNPLFRGFWENGKLQVANALYFLR
ncbi:MAG: zinc carboxypeptidase [Flavobacteriia bacterium]|nr:zinc carboxypeptidase [Flavobacteriia bacterium]